MGSSGSKPTTDPSTEPSNEPVFLDVPPPPTMEEEGLPEVSNNGKGHLLRDGPCREAYEQLTQCTEELEEKIKNGEVGSCVGEMGTIIKCVKQHPKFFQKKV
ncbi:hypothetical protein ACA910_004988 [Epithemia clementina (nom. ined.)]